MLSEISFKFEKMFLKNELQTIISGVGNVTKGSAIQAVSDYLRKSKAAGKNVEEEELVKEQETKALIEYSNKNSFFIQRPAEDRFLAEGAEQKVYLEDSNEFVIKFNDSIFYRTWQDYFNNLLLHNYFFPPTYYELIGFLYESKKLYAAVRQPYIIANETTNEDFVKEVMTNNGFINKKNSDYYSKELGIIVEDLHDENVLTNKSVLFFIDTVFYLTKEFNES